MTRMSSTVPAESDRTLLATADEQGEPQTPQPDPDELRKLAEDAWRMGRDLMKSRRSSRIPRMHPGSWRSGR
jgi:hypothetical protein